MSSVRKSREESSQGPDRKERREPPEEMLVMCVYVCVCDVFVIARGRLQKPTGHREARGSERPRNRFGLAGSKQKKTTNQPAEMTRS